MVDSVNTNRIVYIYPQQQAKAPEGHVENSWAQINVNKVKIIKGDGSNVMFSCVKSLILAALFPPPFAEWSSLFLGGVIDEERLK